VILTTDAASELGEARLNAYSVRQRFRGAADAATRSSSAALGAA
jgi:hypothetical protein